MDIRILGPLEVVGADGVRLSLGGRKPRALLAVLALAAGRTVAASRLVDDLWGDELPDSAAKMVQIHVSHLRKVLPEGVLLTRPPGYQLDVDPEAVDLVRFERAVAAGRAALASGDPAGAGRLLREALGLWRGPARAELPAPFAAAQAPPRGEHRRAAEEDRVEADLTRGASGDLVAEIEEMVAAAPLRERPRAQLMLALYRAGRQAEALAAYRDARRVLSDELGIEPSAALRGLESRILRQDPALDPAPAPGPGPAPPAPAARPPGAPAPVGRASERARLREHLERARSGERRVALLVGEAGAGKTTLVEDLLAEVPPPAVIGRGQCVEHHGPSEAYMPVLVALDRMCSGPAGREVLSLLSARAPTWLAQMPWLVEPSELASLRERNLGANRDRMLREMVEALSALAGPRPVVLVIEDLQWSDHSTVDLLASLARGREPARLLVLGTVRSADGATRDHPVHETIGELAPRGLCDRIELGALSEDDVRRYIGDRLAGLELPEGVVAALRERTGGNPLFVEKAIDAWIARGMIREEDGRHVLVGEASELGRVLPSSVRQLLRRRLHDADEADRRLLEAASVVAPTFSAALAAAAAGDDEDAAEERLEALARDGVLIAARGVEEWPDGTVASRYGFTHDLCHEVLYEDLPAGRRARLHARAGDRLDRAHGAGADTIAAELATHFVRGGEPARAVPHVLAAARRALERHAPRETIELATTGLGLLGDLDDVRERLRTELALRSVKGPALIAIRGWADPAAERAFACAGEIASELGLADEAAWSAFQLASIYEVRGDYVRSERIVEATLRDLDRSLGAPALVDSHELLACSLFHQGAFARAYESAERGLAAYDGMSVNAFIAEYGENPGVACHVWAAQSLWHLGRPDAARDRARRAVALGEEPGRRHALATALSHAAAVHQARLEVDETRRLAEAAIAAAREQGFRYRVAMGMILRGWARAMAGEPGPGVEEIREGIEMARATGARMDDAYFLGLLAEALMRAGRLAEAGSVLDDAVGTVPRGGRFFHDAELNRLQGELLRAEGGPAEAEEHLRRAVAVARRQGSRSLELRAAVSLGELLWAEGRGEEARDLVGPAYAVFEEGFATPDLRRAAAFLADAGAAAPA